MFSQPLTPTHKTHQVAYSPHLAPKPVTHLQVQQSLNIGSQFGLKKKKTTMIWEIKLNMSLGNFIFNDDFQKKKKKRKGERSAGWV